MKSKLAVMLSIPVAGLLCFGAMQITDKGHVVSHLGDLQSFSDLSVRVSSLVHELQKERGATAICVGSKGQKFSSELKAQRTETNEKRESLDIFLASFNSSNYGEEFQTKFQTAIA